LTLDQRLSRIETVRVRFKPQIYGQTHNGVSLAGTFEGEFSNVTLSNVGNGHRATCVRAVKLRVAE
jgi:hypothetical protein